MPNLSHGRHYLAIPGPTVVPDRVQRAMHRTSPNVYEGELVDVSDSIIVDLKRLAGTEHHLAVYVANGHGGWEAVVSNVFSRGDRALAISNGIFGEGWARLASGMGVDVDPLSFGKRSAIDTGRVLERLERDTSHLYKAVLCSHVDTSSSVRNDIASLAKAIRGIGHPALLVVDCIASLGCDPFEMDAWGVDVMLSASQKGLMCPPGLAFVCFGERAREACLKSDLRTPYWDWNPRTGIDGEFFLRFCGTAPTHHLYGLRESLDMIAEEGLGSVWSRHDAIARAVWSAVEAWGSNGCLELNVADPESRARGVTTIRMPSKRGGELRRWLASSAGVTLGIGLGMDDESDPDADGAFRIAHMGHVSSHMALGVLACVESGLGALGVSHGAGALERAARICSSSSG